MTIKSMKKKPFTDQEIQLLKGNYEKIAQKHSVSRQYVRMIVIGEKPVKNHKAKQIFTDLTRLLDTLKQIAG